MCDSPNPPTAVRALTDTEPRSPALSLVVLQSGNVDASKGFYSLLGLRFAQEQHGKGPVHYAATLGQLVLEIYPCQTGHRHAPLRIGFRVPNVKRTLDSLRQRGVSILREIQDSPWGRRAVVEDPDGNRVELTEMATETA